MSLTPERRAELRELCEKATAGPWGVCEDCCGPAYGFEIDGPEEGSGRHAQFQNRPDADFIAASRTALPECLDALDEAEKRNQELDAEVQGILADEAAVLTEREKRIAELEGGPPPQRRHAGEAGGPRARGRNQPANHHGRPRRAADLRGRAEGPRRRPDGRTGPLHAAEAERDTLAEQVRVLRSLCVDALNAFGESNVRAIIRQALADTAPKKEPPTATDAEWRDVPLVGDTSGDAPKEEVKP